VGRVCGCGCAYVLGCVFVCLSFATSTLPSNSFPFCAKHGGAGGTSWAPGLEVSCLLLHPHSTCALHSCPNPRLLTLPALMCCHYRRPQCLMQLAPFLLVPLVPVNPHPSSNTPLHTVTQYSRILTFACPHLQAWHTHPNHTAHRCTHAHKQALACITAAGQAGRAQQCSRLAQARPRGHARLCGCAREHGVLGEGHTVVSVCSPVLCVRAWGVPGTNLPYPTLANTLRGDGGAAGYAVGGQMQTCLFEDWFDPPARSLDVWVWVSAFQNGGKHRSTSR